MAGRARSRTAAGAVLPRGVHAAGADQRHRLPEQGRHLRPPVQGLSRDADHDCRRPEAPRGPDRGHLGAAHLGLGDDAPPARAHDRARRRHRAGWGTMGIVPAGLLPARARSLALVPAIIPHDAGRGTQGQPPQVLWQSCRARRYAGIRRLSRSVEALRVGRLQQASIRWARSRARLSVALYPPRCHLQQPPHRSRRQGSHLQVGRTTAPRDASGPRSRRSPATSSSAASSSTCCRTASTAFATTVCLPALGAPRTSREHASCSTCQSLRAIPPTPTRSMNRRRSHPCPCCGGRMIIIETFERGSAPHYRPAAPTVAIRIDTS